VKFLCPFDIRSTVTARPVASRSFDESGLFPERFPCRLPERQPHFRMIATELMHKLVPAHISVGLRLILCFAIARGGETLLWGQERPEFLRQNPTTETNLGLPYPSNRSRESTIATVALGHRLFFDPILSGNNAVSCATCHKPQFGFADDKPLSRGTSEKTSARNVPSLLNVAYYSSLFWDGRASNLETQVAFPIQSQEEMANTIPAVEQRLNANPSYLKEFAQAFGQGPITFEMVGWSIAAYERTLVSGNSPFDRWKYGHDEKAVSRSVKRGFIVFTSPKKANCAICHTVRKDDALFTDNKFHDIGVGVNSGKIADAGRYSVTHDEADRGKFKTPSLRNVEVTAPYMHDGSLKDLKQVLDFYIGGGNSHPNLDKEIHTLDFLTGQERRDLLNFLKSLKGAGPKEDPSLAIVAPK
jgi:cytochrome c peroxidase